MGKEEKKMSITKLIEELKRQVEVCKEYHMNPDEVPVYIPIGNDENGVVWSEVDDSEVKRGLDDFGVYLME